MCKMGRRARQKFRYGEGGGGRFPDGPGPRRAVAQKSNAYLTIVAVYAANRFPKHV